MTKRILAVLLSLICMLTVLTSCYDHKIDGNKIMGAEVRMYLSEMIYDLDPAVAYNNASAMKICGLLFDTLFSVDANGKVVPAIVDKYEYTHDDSKKEYKMLITLKNNNCWADGTPVSAQDIVFTWKRLLDSDASYEAAALLYEIKNARSAKMGDCSIDDIGVYAVDELVLEIRFERHIDVNAFILNLTSVALAPLREDIVARNEDWAKKPATISCSGPFKLYRVNYGMKDKILSSLYLERNSYYRRDVEKHKLDHSVVPYRLIIDYSNTPEEQLEAFAAGEIFYVGDIALSARANYKDTAVVSDSMSTHTYYLNENADIAKADGTTVKLFADKNIRLALSSAIDRQAIADKVVFAKAASGLIPYGIFETTNAKTLFRNVGGSLVNTVADTSKAQSYISAAGINPADYSFTITARAESAVHCAIAEAVAEAWSALGFNVTVNAVSAIVNDDEYNGEVAEDINDDIFNEKYASGDYQVIAVDLVAFSPDAYSVLAPFATEYSGQKLNVTKIEGTFEYNYEATPHRTGYISEAYNAIIEEVFQTQDVALRAQKLHDAEKLLVEDMPVIPIIFNQDAYLCAKDLSGVKSTYFSFRDFTGAKLKDYIKYLNIEEQ